MDQPRALKFPRTTVLPPLGHHLKRPARESALVARCLQSKMRRLEVAAADPNVTNIAMRTNHHRCMRYTQVQARFLG
jgi:hypothetical protein